MVTAFDNKKVILIGSSGDGSFFEDTKIFSLDLNSLIWVEIVHATEKTSSPLIFRATPALNKRVCGKQIL